MLSFFLSLLPCSQYGTTPLIWAARKGHYDSVIHLLVNGADVDQEGAVSGLPYSRLNLITQGLSGSHTQWAQARVGSLQNVFFNLFCPGGKNV